MKTLEQIKKYEAQCFDMRDLSRLSDFFDAETCEKLGFTFKEGMREKYIPEEYTRENVLKHLKGDLDFAFEKALNGRGISSSFMYSVIQMWNWVLEEGLEEFDDYENYGLPLFKATALKYGFDNPIGDDTGKEYKYSTEGVYH